MVRLDMQVTNLLIKRIGNISGNSAFGHGPVESAAGSEQNAPAHDRHNTGEVAERLNALVLKTSKGL